MKTIKFVLISLFINIIILFGQSTNVIIHHSPLVQFGYPGKPIQFQTRIITSNCSVSKVLLFFRSKGADTFQSVEFQTNQGNTNYVATLTNIQNDLEYFICVTNNYQSYFFKPEQSNAIHYYSLSISPVIESVFSLNQDQTLVLPDDKENEKKTALFVPAFSMREEAVLGIENKTKSLSDFTIPSHLTPVAVYDFYKKENNQKLNLSFDKSVSLTLRYFDEDNDGLDDDFFIDETLLKVFWWDGVKWQKISASVDTQNNVFFLSSFHLGTFGIFYDSSSDSQSESVILDYVSSPSFSPYTGEIVTFGIKNSIQDYKITIFNLQGQIVRKLDGNAWNGCDNAGHYVKSGMYIYQITANTKTIHGLLDVIK